MNIFDIHTHTAAYSPCSTIDPVEHINRASAAGLTGLCITEHNRLWPEREWRALERDAGRRGLLLLAGQEIECRNEDGDLKGHFLIFGPELCIDRPFLPAELESLVHDHKGIIIAAHPYNVKYPQLAAGDEVLDLALDGVEVFHPHHDKQAVDLARASCGKLGAAALGCSDAHRLERLGTLGTIFHRQVHTLEDFVTHIKNRSTSPICMIPDWPENSL